jgi:aryl-alcohol dehydrogenase-like predicted oxidoreductase
VVVATKVFGETGTAGVNSRGSSRYHIMGSVKRACDACSSIISISISSTVSIRQRPSRRRSMRWITWCSRACPLYRRVKLGGLANRQSAGDFRASGAVALCLLQAYYTIAGRDLERELMPMMQSEGSV